MKKDPHIKILDDKLSEYQDKEGEVSEFSDSPDVIMFTAQQTGWYTTSFFNGEIYLEKGSTIKFQRRDIEK